MAFQLHPRAEERKRSATTLIKLLLAEDRPGVLTEHYVELLGILLWKLTEADSQKHKTRFQTQGALNRCGNTKLQHEHVFQKAKMIALLMKAKPEEVDSILQDAVGCTVTKEEHEVLKGFDAEYGWDRYRKAGLTVIDTLTGEPHL